MTFGGDAGRCACATCCARCRRRTPPSSPIAGTTASATSYAVRRRDTSPSPATASPRSTPSVAGEHVRDRRRRRGIFCPGACSRPHRTIPSCCGRCWTSPACSAERRHHPPPRHRRARVDAVGDLPLAPGPTRRELEALIDAAPTRHRLTAPSHPGRDSAPGQGVAGGTAPTFARHAVVVAPPWGGQAELVWRCCWACLRTTVPTWCRASAIFLSWEANWPSHSLRNLSASGPFHHVAVDLAGDLRRRLGDRRASGRTSSRADRAVRRLHRAEPWGSSFSV